ncbi:MAG: hypothetical protein STHCBS139747_004183 [Sporothrix thermara]
MSLGQSHAGHALEHRLDQAAGHGYEGIELFYDDLEYLALTLPLEPPSEILDTAKTTPTASSTATGTVALASTTAPTDSQLVRAAALVRGMCEHRKLVVLCLQPFRHFEGLVDKTARADRLSELRLWCRLAAILRTDLILIPSNFLPAIQLTGDLDVIVQDMRDAADVAAAAKPPVRLCYEALAWGTHIDTWQASWDVVQRVDRSNMGLCLDTFNMAARIYADPALSGGVQVAGQEAMKASLEELVATVDVGRVFLVQVADGARLAAPMQPGHPLFDADMPSRMAWSRNHRLFYSEDSRSGYLPVAAVLDAFFNGLGYRGWVSFELFNRRMSDTDASVPAEMAQRGAESWAKILRDFQLVTERPASTSAKGVADRAVCATRIAHAVNKEDEEETVKSGAGSNSTGDANMRKKPWVRWLSACAASKTTYDD